MRGLRGRLTSHESDLQRRLDEANRRLAEAPRGTVLWLDAQASVHQLERLLLGSDSIPRSSDPAEIRRRRAAERLEHASSRTPRRDRRSADWSEE